jgi:3-methyladenine DNA glycosylase Mpg
VRRDLGQEFFARSAHDVAPELIGATLVVNGVGGRIVEVEAYDREDPASHASVARRHGIVPCSARLGMHMSTAPTGFTGA